MLIDSNIIIYATKPEHTAIRAFFSAALMLPLSQSVLDQAVKLRQLRKMSLGDALVAGTALVHGRTLVTRNIDDFKWIAGLSLLDPLTTP
jgi:predicted nucleic acid-binding protein